MSPDSPSVPDRPRIFTHLLAMVLAIGLCSGGYYYYQNIYIPQNNEELTVEEEKLPIQNKADVSFKASKSIDDSNTHMATEHVNKQINHLKEELVTIHNWRATMNAHFTKMQWEQDVRINKAIDEALEIYEADGIGQMDYAASYAGGIIVGISKETLPHPTHRPLSLFKIVNVDVLSSPEEVIRPCNLPGSCFAFRGGRGSVRIKLGKPISIGAITLSHASRYLLGLEGMSSSPKDFEVVGFTDIDDDTGSFLGKFSYDWMGRQHQTFDIKKKLSNNQVFEEVELIILNNYGKEEFTCVYRFRVHKSDVESVDKSTQAGRGTTGKNKKKCC